MTKGKRELLRMLEQYPQARLESHGRSGYVLVMNGRVLNVGGLQGFLNRRKIERFLRGPR